MRTLLVTLIVGVLLLASCGNASDSATPNATPTSNQVVASDFRVPWDVAFLPSGEALVPERSSRLNILRANDPSQRMTIPVPGGAEEGEGGLMGTVVSPDFAADSNVFMFMTTATDNRIVRFRLSPDRMALTDEQVLVQGLTKARNHNGGRLAFGPDGMLYAGTGDASREELSQDPASLNGKILRMTKDGNPAPGNPDPSSLVYSLGHRNVQGLTWDSAGRMFAAEFGQNRFDEVNRIEAGKNYGWPIVEGNGDTQGGRFVSPIVTWPTSEASPSGITFRAEGQGGALYVAALRGERLWRIPLNADGSAGQPEALLQGAHGRLRTPVVAPDGSIWVTTSNQDGYGSGSEPDRIVRV